MNKDYSIDLAKYRFGKATNMLHSARLAMQMGEYDVVVGRCYYAIFSAIRSLLALKGVDSQTHKGVINLFSRYFIKEKYFPLDFHKLIYEAKTIREKSDYGDFFFVSKEIAVERLEEASLFIKKVEETFTKMILELNRQ
ncbi:MAG: HEPN domain-containing protein [Ignavibacteriae bacterium]|nr:HEPN domain-containing protein [Ignavibacteriota bacterium]